MADGIAGIKHGSRPVQLSEERRVIARDATIKWWREITRAFGEQIEDRERSIASAPSVLSAIGAMGHGLTHEAEANERVRLRDTQLQKLRSVNWQRGTHWEGIAGKVTPKGALTVGGGKETARAIAAALNDEGSPAFARVRQPSA
ncbi:MAG: hypothetical protein AAFW98_11965 [Pseudomonadota bacterium]